VESVSVAKGICRDMEEPTLKRSLINVDGVENLRKQNICGHMKEPTLETSLLNANSVESVLPKQEA